MMSPVVEADSMPSKKFNASVLSSVSRKYGRVELFRDIATETQCKGEGVEPSQSRTPVVEGESVQC